MGELEAAVDTLLANADLLPPTLETELWLLQDRLIKGSEAET